jgi:hypothetical protein
MISTGEGLAKEVQEISALGKIWGIKRVQEKGAEKEVVLRSRSRDVP